tara:strand:+ start:293 stop:613 length:321 start_codon:yes stop_codon:yes gene_type:complete
MLYPVKVLKPNKQGKLKCVKRISAKQAADIHWDNFKTDPNRRRTSFNTATSIYKYHRIGANLKECLEEGCKVTIDDPRRKICSKECMDKRLTRQRIASKNNQLKRR